MHSIGPSSSEEGSRIPLTHSKRASRATPQYRRVLLNVMLALFITGIFSRYERQWAVCPQLKKVVPLLLLPLHGTSSPWRCSVTRTRQQRRYFSAFQSAIFLPALVARQFVHSIGPSSSEGSRIPLTHSKRASRATPQYRMVLLNVMLALFITGIFSRYERQWAVCPQLKKAVPLLLLLPGTVLPIDGDVFQPPGPLRGRSSRARFAVQ